MHSELYLRFRDDVVVERLMAGMPAKADVVAMIATTYTRFTDDLLASAVYSCVEPVIVYVVFRDDPTTLRIHVEGRASKGHLGELVHRSERLSERFIALARRCGYRLVSATISLHAGDDLITIGQRHNFGRRLLTASRRRSLATWWSGSSRS